MPNEVGVRTLNRAVFFDRDGILTEATVRDGKPYPPQSVAQMRVVDGAAPSVRAVRDAGFLAVVVTNQPDVARGTQEAAVVSAINDALAREMPLNAFYVCYHDDADGCDCRKPKPGLLLRAAGDLQIDLASSYLIGDRSGDVEAGRAAGCTTIFVDRGYGETPRNLHADIVAPNVREAVRALFERERVVTNT